jgi:hypothetical protein
MIFFKVSISDIYRGDFYFMSFLEDLEKKIILINVIFNKNKFCDIYVFLI